MIFKNEFQNPSRRAPFAFKVRALGELLTDYEPGDANTVENYDPDFTAHIWAIRTIKVGAFDNQVRFERDDAYVLNGPVVSSPGIEMLAFTFDRYNQPMFGWTEVQGGGHALYFWRDWNFGGQARFFANNVKGVVACRDCIHPGVKRLGYAVVIYHVANSLYYRTEKDDFATERLLKNDVPPNSVLVAAGVNTDRTLQVEMTSIVPGADNTANTVPLPDVVVDLLARSGIPKSHVDVSDLEGHMVEGFKVTTEAGANANIEPLQLAYFFDLGEWDKKLRFIRRGRPAAMTILYDNLLEADVPLKKTRVQEVELLRKLTVITMDSSIACVGTSSQIAERRLATIKAQGVSTMALPITASPDFAATLATKRLRIPWGEPYKFEFGLTMRHSALTPTDVVALIDKSGRSYDVRLMSIDEDYGRFAFEAASNAQHIYPQVAKGTVTPLPLPNIPGQAGDTVVIVVDIPVVRDEDDKLGFYVAVTGTGNAWKGGQVQLSVDGGVSVLSMTNVQTGSIVGTTLSAIGRLPNGEYLSDQTLDVTFPIAPEAVSREQVLNYWARLAVQHADGTWGILQFQTVAQLDDNQYRLGGLVRGRYATDPKPIAGGAHIIPLTNMMFVPLQRWMTTATLSYRGVTFGQSEDDVPWESIVASSPQSQTEWPVAYLHAARDGADTVTVTWLPRARLGVETSPYHSTYFVGFEVTYSDGVTASLAANTTHHVRANCPPNITIAVAQVNSITGPGPTPESITV